MATEEQTTVNTNLEVGDTDSRVGQKLTINGVLVTKLSFKLFKQGSPTGDVTYTIRKVSDDSIITSKVMGDASSIVETSIPGGWYEVTFDSQYVIDEEVYILCEYAAGDDTDNVRVMISSSDVKASENTIRYVIADSAYTEHTTFDTGYIYTFGGTPGSKVYPLEDITRVTGIIHRYLRRKGIYQIELNLGDVSSTPIPPYTYFSLPGLDDAITSDPRKKLLGIGEDAITRDPRLPGLDDAFPIDPRKIIQSIPFDEL